MSTSAGAIFTGNSQFSTDFQQVVQRAVSMASLPMQQMQDDVAALQSQSSEVTSLQNGFALLQAAVAGLNLAVGPNSYSASSSAQGVATAALSGTPAAGTYSVEVDGTGSYATAMSTGVPAVADPTQSGIADATSYTLTVGGAPATITPAGTTLSNLADAINRSGAGVSATVVNVGSGGSPNYRLTIQNGALGATAIQLTAVDGSSAGQQLMAQQAAGAPATYRVNGVPQAPADPLTSNSPEITLAPGVTATLLGPGTTAIAVSRGTAPVANALASFANAYNAVTAELAKNRGQDKGALQGQSLVMSLESALRQVTGYATGTGGVSSLAALGLTFNSKGTLSFDGSAFSTAARAGMNALGNFLGSSDGGGFLQFATGVLNGVTGATSGMLHAAADSINSQITRKNDAIGVQQDRVNTLQANLNKQMAAADAAIAGIEQQYSFLYNMLQSMRASALNGG